MLRQRTQTGSLCYDKEHKLEVYPTTKNTNWKFILLQRTQTGSLSYYKEHKLEVYATRKRHFQLEMVLESQTSC